MSNFKVIESFEALIQNVSFYVIFPALNYTCTDELLKISDDLESWHDGLHGVM